MSETSYEVYDDDDVVAVCNRCDDAPAGRRDRAAIMLMWCAGVRLKELLMLPPDAYDPDLATLHVRTDKPHTTRSIIIPVARRDGLALVLGDWTPFCGSGSLLFCNQHGGAIEASYYRHRLPELAEAAGIDKRFHAQGLRHTFAFNMCCAGVPVQMIAKQLGHRNEKYTVAYLARLGCTGPSSHEYLGGALPERDLQDPVEDDEDDDEQYVPAVVRRHR